MKIYGLTSEQVEMLDKLWTFDTLAQVEEFKDTVPHFRRQQIDTLMEMVRLQILDNMVDEQMDGDYPDAKILLHKLKNKG